MPSSTGGLGLVAVARAVKKGRRPGVKRLNAATGGGATRGGGAAPPPRAHAAASVRSAAAADMADRRADSVAWRGGWSGRVSARRKRKKQNEGVERKHYSTRSRGLCFLPPSCFVCNAAGAPRPVHTRRHAAPRQTHHDAADREWGWEEGGANVFFFGAAAAFTVTRGARLAAASLVRHPAARWLTPCCDVACGAWGVGRGVLFLKDDAKRPTTLPPFQTPFSSQNLIFRFLQSRQPVQIWLYDNVNLRIEGKIIVS